MGDSVESTAKAPTCPGCHFGCSVDAYRCARGQGFYKLWCEGKPVPERGIPPMMRKNGERSDGERVGDGRPGDGRTGEGHKDNVPPVGTRVMHGLNIMANVLQDRHAESPDRKVLTAVGRQGGFFALGMIGKRALLDDDAIAGSVDELVEAGYAVRDEDEIAGPIMRVTPAGKDKLAEWNAERDAATAEFLAPLSDEEQSELADMLFRLIQPQLAHKNRKEA